MSSSDQILILEPQSRLDMRYKLRVHIVTGFVGLLSIPGQRAQW